MVEAHPTFLSTTYLSNSGPPGSLGLVSLLDGLVSVLLAHILHLGYPLSRGGVEHGEGLAPRGRDPATPYPPLAPQQRERPGCHLLLHTLHCGRVYVRRSLAFSIDDTLPLIPYSCRRHLTSFLPRPPWRRYSSMATLQRCARSVLRSAGSLKRLLPPSKVSAPSIQPRTALG